MGEDATQTSTPLGPSPRTALRRMAERGTHQRHVINAILDEGLVCHVAFSAGDHPVVLPMVYGRDGDLLYLHGAPANHLLKTLGDGAAACLSVTLLDGLVLSRSQFHHSINYRSVVLFGHCETVLDAGELGHALATVVDHVVPGRSSDARPPTPSELRATRVVRFPIHEGSAKIRTGGPKEEPADLALEVWGGVVPLRMVTDPPVPDTPPGAVAAPAPGYATSYGRPGQQWPSTAGRNNSGRPEDGGGQETDQPPDSRTSTWQR